MEPWRTSRTPFLAESEEKEADAVVEKDIEQHQRPDTYKESQSHVK